MEFLNEHNTRKIQRCMSSRIKAPFLYTHALSSHVNCYSITISQHSACRRVQRLLDKEGTIQSPGYNDGQYPIEFTCKWLIFGPKDSTISLTFEDFALEESEKCTGTSGLSGKLGGRPDSYCGYPLSLYHA